MFFGFELRARTGKDGRTFKNRNAVNSYVAIGGGGVILTPPQTGFYCHALKPLGIVRNALVTFPRYVWPKKCCRNV